MSEIAFTVFKKNLTPIEPIVPDIDPKLETLRNIDVVMFDVYGTLFVSGSGDIGTATADPKVGSLELALEAVDIQTNEPAEIVLNRHYDLIQQSHAKSRENGVSFPEVDILEIWNETMLDYDLSAEQLEELAVEFESRANPVWPMPELESTLATLKATRQMGIVSNAQFFTLDLFEVFLGQTRQQLGFDQELEVFSFAESTAKPGLEIYEIVAQRLSEKGIIPEKVLYVGNDMLNDITPAQKIGFKTALFAGDKRSLRLRNDDQRVDGVRPDIIVKCLSQIIDCIEQTLP